MRLRLQVSEREGQRVESRLAGRSRISWQELIRCHDINDVEPILHIQVNSAGAHIAHVGGVVLQEDVLHAQVPNPARAI